MKVHLKIVCQSLLSPLESGVYELSTGANTQDLLDAAIKRHGSPDPRALEFLLFFIDSSQASAQTELKPDAQVMITKAFTGG